MSTKTTKKQQKIRDATRLVLLLFLGFFLIGVYLVWVWLSDDVDPAWTSFLLILSLLLIPAWLVIKK